MSETWDKNFLGEFHGFRNVHFQPFGIGRRFEIFDFWNTINFYYTDIFHVTKVWK